MTDPKTPPSQSEELLGSVWAEAHDLIRRLEGTSVQRLVVAVGDARIEVKRAVATPGAAAAADVAQLAGQVATGAGPGPGVAPGARTASGAFAAITDGADDRRPVLAPLVGTFYRSAQPGAKPFVKEGDVVEVGQTVCIVEAMKMMNEVGTGEAGRVAEVLVQDGDPVEFEQVLMYLEPLGE